MAALAQDPGLGQQAARQEWVWSRGAHGVGNRVPFRLCCFPSESLPLHYPVHPSSFGFPHKEKGRSLLLLGKDMT